MREQGYLYTGVFSYSGRLLLVWELMPLHLPPAHGQAKLSKVGSRDQRKFSGRDAGGVGREEEPVCTEAVRVRTVGGAPTVSTTRVFLFFFLSK